MGQTSDIIAQILTLSMPSSPTWFNDLVIAKYWIYCLGPCLFQIYASDLRRSWETWKMVKYADDSSLLVLEKKN